MSVVSVFTILECSRNFPGKENLTWGHYVAPTTSLVNSRSRKMLLWLGSKHRSLVWQSDARATRPPKHSYISISAVLNFLLFFSGYVILAGFSILNAAALVLIISVRPMAGNPLMDVCAGAICAVSVIVLGLSLTGLTMSGCCKTPPPDNRVTYA